MIAEEKAVTEIKSVEEYSLYSLDRSMEGLEYIEEDAITCCKSIEAERLTDAYRQLTNLASQLHSFDVFENELAGLFSIDKALPFGNAGSLGETENSFRQALLNLGNLLERNNMNAVPVLIRESLLPALGRFRDLIPHLRDYIATEYANA